MARRKGDSSNERDVFVETDTANEGEVEKPILTPFADVASPGEYTERVARGELDAPIEPYVAPPFGAPPPKEEEEKVPEKNPEPPSADVKLDLGTPRVDVPEPPSFDERVQSEPPTPEKKDLTTAARELLDRFRASPNNDLREQMDALEAALA